MKNTWQKIWNENMKIIEYMTGGRENYQMQINYKKIFFEKQEAKETLNLWIEKRKKLRIA